MARVQIRSPGQGRDYYERREADGKALRSGENLTPDSLSSCSGRYAQRVDISGIEFATEKSASN